MCCAAFVALLHISELFLLFYDSPFCPWYLACFHFGTMRQSRKERKREGKEGEKEWARSFKCRSILAYSTTSYRDCRVIGQHTTGCVGGNLIIQSRTDLHTVTPMHCLQLPLCADPRASLSQIGTEGLCFMTHYLGVSSDTGGRFMRQKPLLCNSCCTFWLCGKNMLTRTAM